MPSNRPASGARRLRRVALQGVVRWHAQLSLIDSIARGRPGADLRTTTSANTFMTVPSSSLLGCELPQLLNCFGARRYARLGLLELSWVVSTDAFGKQTKRVQPVGDRFKHQGLVRAQPRVLIEGVLRQPVMNCLKRCNDVPLQSLGQLCRG